MRPLGSMGQDGVPQNELVDCWNCNHVLVLLGVLRSIIWRMYSRFLFTLSPHRVNSERPGMGLVDSMQDTVLFGVENHGELSERETCDGFCIYSHIFIYANLPIAHPIWMVFCHSRPSWHVFDGWGRVSYPLARCLFFAIVSYISIIIGS